MTMINRNLNCIYLKDITFYIITNKLINEKFI